MRKIICVTCLIACFIFGALPLANAQFSFMDFLKEKNVGQSAPDFTLAVLNGKEDNMTKARGGKKAILFFWATWCPHCRSELKRLNENVGEIEKKGIKLFLVDLGESKEDVQHYVDRYKVNLPIFLDQDSTLSDPYGVVGVPTLVFINEKGTVTAVEHAFPSNYEKLFALEANGK